MAETVENIEHSYEVEEIIGNIPSWLIRWGIVMFLVIFSVIILTLNIIKYPSILASSVIIRATEQPFKLSWLKDGQQSYISKIKDGQHIKLNDTLLLEINPAGVTTSVVTSPVAGKVFLIRGAEDNPRKNTIIVSPELKLYEVLLYIKPERIGEVQPHQNVLINLEEYSPSVFGSLEGKIVEVIRVPIHNRYVAKVKLTNGLYTTTHRSIPLASTLTGNSYIELSKRSIFLRIFGSLLG